MDLDIALDIALDNSGNRTRDENYDQGVKVPN